MKPSGDVLYKNFAFSLLELCPRMFAPLLCTSFSSIIHTIIYPDNWKTAFFTPLHTSDSKTDIANYKPIRLVLIVSLISDENIFQFLYNKMKGRITPRHFGFQQRKSAVIQMIDFLEAVSLENFTNIYTVYLIMRKLSEFLFKIYCVNFV